jgi:hypothetical protein
MALFRVIWTIILSLFIVVSGILLQRKNFIRMMPEGPEVRSLVDGMRDRLSPSSFTNPGPFKPSFFLSGIKLKHIELNKLMNYLHL